MSTGNREVSEAVRTAARNLQSDCRTARVLSAFRAAGVDCLLLKGPSITRWLYASDGTRAYTDRDLLVAPACQATASRLLRELRFEPRFNESEMPGWWREHALAWWHPEAGTVDLHRTLPGVGVDDEELWWVLSSEALSLEVGGATAAVLSIPARALHLVLHAAHHGHGLATPILDLERALQVTGADTWEAAARLAERLDAADAFAAGLALRPAGRALASRLGLPEPRAVDVVLRAAGASSQALTVGQLFAATDLRARVAIVRAKLFPPATYMHHWSPSSRRGRFSLCWARARRVGWVLVGWGPAVLAWRRAHRAAIAAGAQPPRRHPARPRS